MLILIADYHALMRDGIAILVKELAPDIDVAQCDSFGGIETMLERRPCDLLLVDGNLPGFNGPSAIHRLRERNPDLPIVVMAATERWEEACQLVEAGARGYMPKSAGSTIMLAALRLILSGGTYVPPPVSRGASGATVSIQHRDAHAGATAFEPRLTPRQIEVLRCLARGHSNKEIAYQLGLSQGTVKIHIAAIFRAFKVRNRTQAVIAAGLRI